MTRNLVRPFIAFGQRFPVVSLVIIALVILIGFGFAFPNTRNSSPVATATKNAVSDALSSAALAKSSPSAIQSSEAPLSSSNRSGTAATPPTSLATSTMSAVTIVPTPSPVLFVPAEIRRRAIAAEGMLHTGQITATDDFNNETRTITALRFDLGEESHIPSMHFLAVYQGVTSSQTIEQIIVGDSAWQRQADGGWKVIAAQRSTREEIRAFLPDVASAPADTSVEVASQTATLRWYDAARDTDVAMDIDPVSGIPERATQRIRTTGAQLTVIYNAWNVNVTITPP